MIGHNLKLLAAVDTAQLIEILAEDEIIAGPLCVRHDTQVVSGKTDTAVYPDVFDETYSNESGTIKATEVYLLASILKINPRKSDINNYIPFHCEEDVSESVQPIQKNGQFHETFAACENMAAILSATGRTVYTPIEIQTDTTIERIQKSKANLTVLPGYICSPFMPNNRYDRILRILPSLVDYKCGTQYKPSEKENELINELSKPRKTSRSTDFADKILRQQAGLATTKQLLESMYNISKINSKGKEI